MCNGGFIPSTDLAWLRHGEHVYGGDGRLLFTVGGIVPEPAPAVQPLTQQEITALRQLYESLVRERARIEEEIEDVRDALLAAGIRP
jgi:hypothetical protein